MRTVGGGWETFPVVGFGQPAFNRIAVRIDAPDGARGRHLSRPALRGELRPRRGLLVELQQLRPRRHRPYQAPRLAPDARRIPSAVRPAGSVAPAFGPADPSFCAGPCAASCPKARREPPGRKCRENFSGGERAPTISRNSWRVSLPPLRPRANPAAPGPRGGRRAGRKTRRSDMEDLKTRGTMAASRFLSRRGYECPEEGWRSGAGECEVIALDGDVLAFVKVRVRSDAAKGFPVERGGACEREERERIAVDYLAGHPEHADVGVRFDTAAILVIGPDRALIRHHINCMGASEPMWPDACPPGDRLRPPGPPSRGEPSGLRVGHAAFVPKVAATNLFVSACFHSDYCNGTPGLLSL